MRVREGGWEGGEREGESERDTTPARTLSFAATTDPFHIDATVNVTPVSRTFTHRSFSPSCSSSALARGC